MRIKYPTSIAQSLQPLGLLFIAVMLASCAGLNELSPSIQQEVYEVDENFAQDLFLRQHGVDSARVYVDIRTDQLLHKRSKRGADYQVILDFEVNISEFGQVSLDTLNFRFDQHDDKLTKDQVKGYFTIPLVDTVAYQIKILVHDVLSKRSRQKIFFAGNEPYDSRYISYWVNGVPSRHCACNPGDEVLVDIHGWQNKRTQLSTYKGKPGLAPPPFSVSIRQVAKLTLLNSEKVNHSGGISITCPQADYMHLQNLETEALVELPVFSRAYPKITTHRELMAPLAYVTSSNEYKEMQRMDNPREAVEQFWLNCAGNKERAKSLISRYYSRVEEANRFFTEDVEGWRTDRGIMHLVHGPPANIMRLEDREIWFYGAEGSGADWNVVFYRKNGYRMDRSLDYRPTWFLTVDSWRNGRTVGQ